MGRDSWNKFKDYHFNFNKGPTRLTRVNSNVLEVPWHIGRFMIKKKSAVITQYRKLWVAEAKKGIGPWAIYASQSIVNNVTTTTERSTDTTTPTQEQSDGGEGTKTNENEVPGDFSEN